LQQQEVGRLVVPVSMLEAIDEFIDWRAIKMRGAGKNCDRELRSLCLFLRNPEVRVITFTDIMDYLKGLLEVKALHPNSLMNRAISIRKFFEYTRKRGLTTLDEELIPVPRQQYTIPRVADDDNYKKLINSIPGKKKDYRTVRNLAILALMWDTGARSGEICSLDVADIDINNKRALIRTEKNRGSRPFREIFWTEETNKSVSNWLKAREKFIDKPYFKDCEAMFISIAGTKPFTRITPHGISNMLSAYCTRAGIPYINAHSMRHHKAHDIAEKTGSAIDVMNILGHVSIKSSTRYVQMRDSQLEKRARMIMAR